MLLSRTVPPTRRIGVGIVSHQIAKSSVIGGNDSFVSHHRQRHQHHATSISHLLGRHRPFSTSNITKSPPKNELKRHKLHIGFASLANTLPFSSPETSSTDEHPSSSMDPRASIMLTALRGGVSSLDCPAPPLMDGDASSFEKESCWRSNRQAEVQMANALDEAWGVLMEEDDGEAMRALHGNADGDDGAAVTISTRLGYRSAAVLSDETGSGYENDVQEKEGAFTWDARVGVLHPGVDASEAKDGEAKAPVALVHNLSQEYVLHSLQTSPLVERYKLDNTTGNAKKIQLISLAHNPETQIAAYLLSNQEEQKSTLLQRARDHMKQCLTSAFIGYEIAVKDGLIDGYGVDSNGLSLPTDHDMSLEWRDILECAVDAFIEVNGGNVGGKCSLKVVRLPGNLLERRGLEVAKEICSFFGDCGDETNSSLQEEGLPSFTDDQNDPNVQQKRRLRKMRNILPTSLKVHVTRPLTAYPFGGTGWEPTSSPGLTENSGAPPSFLQGKGTDGKIIDKTHPIRLLDYQIESGSIGQSPQLDWTNYHYNHHGPRPSAYQPILNAALSHFDAESILEASRERELTVEERETLDGCKLLRDMIHDLDASLDTMKSFAAYEKYLVNVAVPLIYGSFEELDEESAGVLQLFFRVHGMAVRMAVARWTRDMLLGGWKRANDGLKGDVCQKTLDKDQEKKVAKLWKALGFGFTGGYDVPEDVVLQEFALKYLLEVDSVRGVVIGCSRPEHVLEAMRAADASGSDGS
jgi:hypothetical protein